MHFGELRVEGEERISPRLIVLHAGLDRGTRFDRAELEAARGRLFNLGVFSSVRMEYEQHADEPSVADVIVHVRETKLGELRLGAGLGLDFYRTELHATASYMRRNWLGGLRTLTLRLEPAWVAVPALWDPQRTGPAGLAEADFIQPDWPLPLGKLELAVGYDVGVEYAYQFHGPRATLGLQRGFWRDRVFAGASYNFQFLQFFDTDPAFLDDPALAGRLFGYTNPYRIGWFQQDLALDLRDRAARRALGRLSSPRRSRRAGSTRAAPSPTRSSFRSCAPTHRSAAASRSPGASSSDSYSARASSAARSRVASTSAARIRSAASTTSASRRRCRRASRALLPIPIGGDQMVLVSAELRFDVVRLFGHWLVVAAFVDGGDVGAPSCSGGAGCAGASLHGGVDWGDLHWAAGGGLRYRTIIGSIRADLGVRLNRLAPFEADGTPNPDPGQRFAFHLSLGEAF